MKKDKNRLIRPNTKGGKRIGAGRPFGSGRYKEKTYPVRIPESLLPKVNKMLNDFVSNNPEYYLPIWNLIGTAS
jgi:hypothetical protein